VIPDLIEYFMAACACAWAAIFFGIHRNAAKGREQGSWIADCGLWLEEATSSFSSPMTIDY
jgi:hypothetical protein